MRIVLQPAARSAKHVEQHYQDTIARPVVFDEHRDVLGPEVHARLVQLFPAGSAPMWGITPGKDDHNVPIVNKISTGDWVFFSGDKRLYLGGTIALRWRNHALAERLWGLDEKGQTWEHMYALSGIQGFDITVQEVRETLGWKEKRNIQGISVLEDEASETLQTLLTLEPAAAEPSEALDPAEEDAAVAAFDGDLERKAQRAYRGEQSALKRRLLRGPTGRCALCGSVLPAAFLVAAHIKKRAVCSDDEKRDLGNIAMLACTLGCDVLYEHGYVTVATGGALQVSPLATGSGRIADYIAEMLEGRTVDWWSADRELYYEWHRSRTFKKGAPS